MDFLINPNVSYVLLIFGFLVAVLALFSPGTGVLEIVALFSLALAGYGIANMPVNVWAFAIMAVALIPFFLALRKLPRRTAGSPAPVEMPSSALKERARLLGAAALAFVIGSALLFPWQGWQPGVHPLLILLLSALVVGVTWLIASKMLEAITSRPAFDLERLVGMQGEARSDIRGHGTVYVNGEEWTAYSKSFIPEGSPVRVLRREGLTLEVERVN